ncbi:MAG TPA: hypothetical protein DCL61_16785 [Cyanobacteria bacterium UBA12227]|nr:hypothetical protein [Cyanobacteria bacterium UBA12227]HAX89630.1 hypothetical protein [Cyanobacteria bacterium UBA11370]
MEYWEKVKNIDPEDLVFIGEPDFQSPPELGDLGGEITSKDKPEDLCVDRNRSLTKGKTRTKD